MSVFYKTSATRLASWFCATMVLLFVSSILALANSARHLAVEAVGNLFDCSNVAVDAACQERRATGAGSIGATTSDASTATAESASGIFLLPEEAVFNFRIDLVEPLLCALCSIPVLLDFSL
jgi:hypothetical protein